MCLESPAIQIQQNKYEALLSIAAGSLSMLPALVFTLELLGCRMKGNVGALVECSSFVFGLWSI